MFIHDYGMRWRRALLLFVIACTLLFPRITPAQEGETAVAEAPADVNLPDAKKVHEDYLVALGGREELGKVQSTRSVGEFSITGIKGTLTVLKARPNKMIVDIDLGNMGKVNQGTNGEIAWDVNPGGTPTILEGAQKEDRMKQADFDEELHVDQYYKSMTCVAKEDIDGKPCYKIECVSKGDQKEIRYYDVDSHYLVRADSTQKGPFGPMKIEARLSDYREVGTTKMPYVTSVKVLGQEQVITLKEVEHDVKLEDNAFDPPEAIKKKLADAAPSK